MNINRNQDYYAIVFDWEFKTQSKICPPELGRIYENFNKYMNENYIFFSDEILISKNESNNIVKTIIDFSNMLKTYKPLINVMQINRAEVIKFQANGDVLKTVF